MNELIVMKFAFVFMCVLFVLILTVAFVGLIYPYSKHSEKIIDVLTNGIIVLCFIFSFCLIALPFYFIYIGGL